MNVIDKKIIDELRKNSRETNKVIAEKIGMSEGTVRNRIRKLLDDNIIRRFTVDLGTSRGFMAVVLLESDPSKPTNAIVEKMLAISDVVKVYESAGRWDIVTLVDTQSPEKFNDVIEEIRSIGGIVDTETLTVLKVN